MAYFNEIPESRELEMDPPSATHHWVGEGTFDDYEIGNIARLGTPLTWQHPLALLYRNNMQIKEAGHKLYNVTVHYGLQKKDIGSYRLEFDTLGGSVHVNAGVPVATYPSSFPNHDGVIGWNGTDNVEGADFPISAMRVIAHYSHPGNYLTDAKIRALSRLVGSVDNSGIFGWDPYETLFLGAQGSQSTDVSTAGTEQREEVAYHFAMSENLVNFSIGSVTGITKKGWDVGWVKWKDTEVNGMPSQEVHYVNVVRIGRERNLKNLLGIG